MDPRLIPSVLVGGAWWILDGDGGAKAGSGMDALPWGQGAKPVFAGRAVT